MLGGLKQQWQAFRRSRPGHRFEHRHERSRKRRASQPRYLRVLKPFVAIILIAVGVVLCIIPGPGIPFIIVGAGLLGDEWRPLAQVLDWLEIRIRKVVTCGKHWWKQASLAARGVVMALAVSAAGGIAYLGYRFFLSN